MISAGQNFLTTQWWLTTIPGLAVVITGLALSLIGDGLVTAVHDVSDGGLLIALAEMAMASRLGAVLEAPADVPVHAFWLGEDQARYVITATDADSVMQLGVEAEALV